MDTNFIQYLTKISPYTMFISNEEKITALYLQNKASLTPKEITFLLDIIINHLSLYIMNVEGVDDVDIEPIVTLVQTKTGELDCIVLIKDSQLRGVRLVNGEDFKEIMEDIGSGSYPINYLFSAHKARSNDSTDLEMSIGKLFEGKQYAVMGQLEYLFKSTGLKVYEG